jgi:oligoendopeptidase F
MSLHRAYAWSLFLCVLSVAAAHAQERDRTTIADQYTWNLADIYPSDEAWRVAKEEFVKNLPSVDRCRGTLGQSAHQMLECLDLLTRLNKDFARLYSYASMKSDQDTRVSTYLAMQQEISQIATDFDAKTSFVRPEILSMDRATIDRILTQENGLEQYRQMIDDIVRRQAHTRTESEEKIIADAGLMADGPHSINSVFSNAEFPYPTITMSDGKNVKLDASSFNLYRTVPTRSDRQQVFKTFFGALYEYRRTFGAQMGAQVKRDMFYARARNYESSLQSALDANNIPVAVYHALIENVNKNLGTFHRYLALRKRMMGLDTLHYYDLYAPLVPGVELRYTVDEAQRHVAAALAPLGSEYVRTVQRAYRERWIDYYPTEGKRSGAYSNGSAYDVHPYILLNYNGKYDDVSTLAHELGHTMHSYLSNAHQPYQNAQYPIFLAEVASTFNEALLIDYMTKRITDDRTRLSLLGNYLEGIKATVFRQTQFAEFELRMHELAEKGQPLTGDVLNDLYAGITRKYYGHDQGVCIVGDEIKSEWSYIPHFYYDFYVFQYATSFTASTALSEPVLAGNTDATKRYLAFLSSGSSDYAINLLKKAGVDMTTSAPFELTMKRMNRVIDEMEQILNRMKK